MDSLVRFASSAATTGMEDQQRLLHQGQVSMASGVMTQQTGYDQNMQQSGNPSDPDQRKQEIGDILQQIMTITDQSLDEAQARWVDRRVQIFISIFSEFRFLEFYNREYSLRLCAMIYICFLNTGNIP